MKIAGLQKLSLIDYPGKISSVIFTQGCNFRCGYCHNPQLVLPELFQATIPKEKIFDFLKTRIGKIEGVVITGGEPTIHTDLIDFIKEIKTLGFLVKLDTNGSNPKMLKEIIDKNLIDFIAMDVKTTFDKYDDLCGVKINTGNILESIELIKNFVTGKQFRITLLKGVHNFSEVSELERSLGIQLSLQSFKYSPLLLSNNLDCSFEFPEHDIKLP